MFTLSAFADEISPDPQEQIDVLTRCGVRCIELRSILKTNVLDLTDLQISEFKSLLDRHGFRLSAIGSPIGKIRIDQPFEPHLKRFQRAVELCKVFDTPNIRVFSYYPPGDAEDWNGVSDGWQHELFRRLEEQVRLASAGRRPPGPRERAPHLRRLAGAGESICSSVLPSAAFRAVYDAANYVFCGYDPWEGWQKTKDVTAHFHIKDWVAGEKHGSLAGEGQGRHSRGDRRRGEARLRRLRRAGAAPARRRPDRRRHGAGAVPEGGGGVQGHSRPGRGAIPVGGPSDAHRPRPRQRRRHRQADAVPRPVHGCGRAVLRAVRAADGVRHRTRGRRRRQRADSACKPYAYIDGACEIQLPAGRDSRRDQQGLRVLHRFTKRSISLRASWRFASPSNAGSTCARRDGIRATPRRTSCRRTPPCWKGRPKTWPSLNPAGRRERCRAALGTAVRTSPGHARTSWRSAASSRPWNGPTAWSSSTPPTSTTVLGRLGLLNCHRLVYPLRFGVADGTAGRLDAGGLVRPVPPQGRVGRGPAILRQRSYPPKDQVLRRRDPGRPDPGQDRCDGCECRLSAPRLIQDPVAGVANATQRRFP